MTSTRISILVGLVLSLAWWSLACAGHEQLARGRQAILSMTGCYLVDYSYVETEALRPGYERDQPEYPGRGVQRRVLGEV